MAAPVAGNVRLPLDTGNTGKYKRTQTRTVGAESVHSDYVIVEDKRSLTGSFQANSTTLTVPAAIHNGTTTGFLWFYNPVGSAVKVQMNRAILEDQFIALAVDLLGGECRASIFTFTGTGSGALVTPSKRDSTDAASVANVRTASTGLSCTLGATIFSKQYQTMGLVTGGAGSWSPDRFIYLHQDKNDQIVLRAGEGIVFWHAVAVTTANRRLYINLDYDEWE